MHIVFFSLGSNLGQRKRNIKAALKLIEKRVGTIVCSSSFIETAPWGYESANKYINMCVKVQTALTPEEVLDTTQEIEKALGRTQKSLNGIYHDRLIDIDMLLYDKRNIQTEHLTLPHPRMRERDFVMIPLREIANDEDIY